MARPLEIGDIQKGVPLPERRSATKSIETAIERLEVGDSILIGGRSSAVVCSRYAPLVAQGRKFTARTRVLERDGEVGVRVWRTA